MADSPKYPPNRGAREPIVPEDIVLDTPGYAPGHWDYRRRCEDVDLALSATRERIEEWDRADLHGWWHERPLLIALYNAVVQGGDRTRFRHVSVTLGDNDAQPV